MEQGPRNRPRIFLSHAKADIAFIQKLYDDLLLCQVDPWLDSVEIRHGQPWLDAVFGSGIPTCDMVLVYLTPDSIASPMVKKEIDASIIKKLHDSHIAFLPYVSDAKLRDNLRADLQALQTPEWNGANYGEMLPRVVAEIWHSFSERVALSVSSEEKVRRLEAELQLERLRKAQGDSPFDDREKADFAFAWERFDRWEPVEFVQLQKNVKKSDALSKLSFRIQVRTLVATLGQVQRSGYDRALLRSFLLKTFAAVLPTKEALGTGTFMACAASPDLTDELLMYGLVELPGPISRPGATYSYPFTDKMYRFRYWLAYTGQIPGALVWEARGPEEETS